MYFIFLLILSIAYAKYSCNQSIYTSFSKKSELMDFMNSTYFFKKYLEIVGSEKVTFHPTIQDRSYLHSIQEIEYITTPNITLLNTLLSRFGKVKIKQKWTNKGDIICGIIDTFYMSFDLAISCSEKNGNIVLELNAQIKNKRFFIPNQALKYALSDFGGIFKEIMMHNAMCMRKIP